MDTSIKKMLKSVIVTDLILAMIICASGLVVKSSYVIIALIGLLIAALNFAANSVLTNFTFAKQNSNKIFLLIGGIIRVVIVCVIAFILYKINKFYIVAYMFGFTAQYISIVIYGLKTKNE